MPDPYTDPDLKYRKKTKRRRQYVYHNSSWMEGGGHLLVSDIGFSFLYYY